jgi:sarcosine oxidase subunit beta
VRLQFSTLANVEMSCRSIEALARFEDEMGENIDFRENGYLFVLTSETQLETFRGNGKKTTRHGSSSRGDYAG